VVNHKVHQQLAEYALDALAADLLPSSADPPTGVRALDLWSNGRYGGVLFWVEGWLDLWSFGEPALHVAHAKRFPDGAWRWTGADGGGSSDEPDRMLAGRVPGLYKLSCSSSDPLRLTIAMATPEVSAIVLRSQLGAQSRVPGADGFVLLGITHQDPITYAHPIARDGHELPGEPLLL